jgi:phage FluMu gp28-like protein
MNSSPPFPLRSPVQKSGALYFKSRVTIHDAIASGLPLDPAELQAGLNDPEAWSQEYLCEFMDSSTVMFPYDLIAPCESEQATELLAGGATAPAAVGPLYAGIDFGRKHHLTVCWILEALPTPSSTSSHLPSAICHRHMFITREVLTIKNTSTPEQIEILRPRLQRCRRVCLDYTGSGVGLGDYLVKEFGEVPGKNPLAPFPFQGERDRVRGFQTRSGKIELCQFTTALKSELFPRLRAAFEQRLLRIPISREIREDLHAIQRCVTHSGQITYRAPNTADGHSDRTTALALALRAAGTGAPISAPARSIFVRGRSADLRWSQRSLRHSRPLRRVWL